MRIWATLQWLAVLFWAHQTAADDQWQPEIVTSEFSGVTNLLQFEDSARLMLFNTDGLFFSKDAGKQWEKVEMKDEDGNQLTLLGIQEFDNDRSVAMAFSETSRHYYTTNQGDSWQFFDIPLPSGARVISGDTEMNFVNPASVIFSFEYVTEDEQFLSLFGYTDDMFKSGFKKIEVENLQSCKFTKSNVDFTVGFDNMIICVMEEFNSFGFLENTKVITSSDFFKNVQINEKLTDLLVSSVVIEGPYVILTVRSDKYATSTNSKLYLSRDGLNFHEAQFENQTRNWSYQILYSNKDMIYIAAYGKTNEIMPGADVYRSDYDGSFFTKIIDDIFANILGMSMISKVQMLDGVWITARHTDTFSERGVNSESKITLDDGKTWSPMKSNDDDCDFSDNCSVHLAWVSHRAGDGKVVTGQTPGILVGVGNKGKYLTPKLDELETFVSRDGGLSWDKIASGPSIFSFGDLGNVIITVPVNVQYFFNKDTSKSTDHFSYSLDQGMTWTEVKLNNNIIPLYILNNEDNTDLTFVLNSVDAKTQLPLLYTIDFSNAFKDTCKDSDMEEWISRYDPSIDKNTCVYGHNEVFTRRKSDAECFVNHLYEDLKVVERPCKCTNEDYQCSYGFTEKGDKCEPNVQILSERYCIKDSNIKKVKLTSKILPPGNLCSGGVSQVYDDYVLHCDSKNIPKPKPKIIANVIPLDEDIKYYQYFENDPQSEDLLEDTLVILTEKNHIYISYDGGHTLGLVSADQEIIGYYFNPYHKNQLFLVSKGGMILYSKDRGHNFEQVASPYFVIGQENVNLIFSKSDENSFIISANTGCKTSTGCVRRALLMIDDGKNAIELPDGIRNCVFGDTVFEYENTSELLICDQVLNDNIQFSKLISSRDLFKTDNNILVPKIVGFTTTDKYMVVGEVLEEQRLRALVSVDGKTFSEVKFPHDYDDIQQHAYTILDVASGELFFHLTTSSEPEKEYGALLKGNFNGTLFSTIHKHVNRNGNAFVDFEDVKSLEGLQLMNVVINADDLNKAGAEKKLSSLVSHNDGATWSLLSPPSIDSEGKRYNCKDCSLHLHSYTERIDPSRDTFGSDSALGLLFGLGNVGNSLSPLEGDDTALYFSNDGGYEWSEVAKGRYMWEFGDQGTVLIISRYDEPIDSIQYSLDMGKTWQDYKFIDDDKPKVIVKDLATVPSDTSLKFLMIAKEANGSSQKLIPLDFTQIYSRQCSLYLQGPIGEDYEYFTPQPHNKGKGCLFGHKSKYLRRKANSDCFVGSAPLSLGFKQEENCQCTRDDYECDYNYELTISGTCKLVKGLENLKGDEVCKDPNAVHWYEPTGYRKLTGSTCEGGLVLDEGKSHLCPGKVDNRESRLTGLSMFFIIFVPLLVFAGSVAFVYDRGIRRNGGFSRFGVIRLDEDDEIQLIEENATDVVVNKIVRFGVMVFQIGARALNGIRTRLRGSSGYRSVSRAGEGSMGAFFNDMVDETDDHDDIFGGLSVDQDAREIDEMLARDDDDEFELDFSEFQTNTPVTGHYSDAALQDDDDDAGAGDSNSPFRPQDS